MRWIFGMACVVSLLFSGCSDDAKQVVTQLEVRFAPCLGPVESTEASEGTAPTCRGALGALMSPATSEASIHACLLLKPTGSRAITRVGFRWDAPRLLPLESEMVRPPEGSAVAALYIFSAPRATCGELSPEQKCREVEGCLLRLHDENVTPSQDGTIIDFRTDVGECNVNPRNQEIKLACQGCDWPRPDCEPGVTEEVACGTRCGYRSRICQPHCAWTPFGECSDGQCVAGRIEEASCGRCGTQSRLCSEKCVWESFSECRDELGCVPGAAEMTACGNCGRMARTCDAECQWIEGECDRSNEQCAPREVDLGARRGLDVAQA